MKIIEALKNLKTIEKRLKKQASQIEEYASYVSLEGLKFASETEQRSELAGLVQSNIDLVNQYLKLKSAIDRTNLETDVTIEGKTYNISSWILMRRLLGQENLRTYQSLNNTKSMQRMQTNYRQVDATNPPRVISLFDEKEKNMKIREWEEVLSGIDAKLEIVNAETELLM